MLVNSETHSEFTMKFVAVLATSPEVLDAEDDGSF